MMERRRFVVLEQLPGRLNCRKLEHKRIYIFEQRFPSYVAAGPKSFVTETCNWGILFIS